MNYEFSFKIFSVATATAVTILCLALPAEAATSKWFPYSNASDGITSPIWGQASNPIYDHLDGGDAIVYNHDSVYYDTANSESWFDTVDTDMAWHLLIHNPTTTDFTGSDALRIILFEPDGTRVDESTTWTDGTSSLINQDPDTDLSGSPISWNATEDRFDVEIPAGESVQVNCLDVLDSLYDAPSNAAIFLGSIWVRQNGNHDFMATLHGGSKKTWRKATTPFEGPFDHRGFTFGYAPVDLADYPSGSSEDLILPFWRESIFPYYDDTSYRYVADWATIVYILNSRNVTQNVTVSLYDLEGTLIDSKVISMTGRELLPFAPGQLMTSSSADMGFLKVSGDDVASVALYMRTNKTSSSKLSEKSGVGTDFYRVISSEAVPLFVKD